MEVLRAAMAILVVALGGPLPADGSPRAGGSLLFATSSFLGVGALEIGEGTAREIGLVEPHGVEISNLTLGGPAERAGLRVGDIVLTYRGERVNGAQHFARLVRETPAGRTVRLEVARDGKRMSIDVEIGAREQKANVWRTLDSARQGLRTGLGNDSGLLLDLNVPKVHMIVSNRRIGADLESLDGQLASYFGVVRGVLVRHVEGDSSARRAGLEAGDVILEIDGHVVATADEATSRLAASVTRRIELTVARDRARRTLELDLGPRGRSVVQ